MRSDLVASRRRALDAHRDEVLARVSGIADELLQMMRSISARSLAVRLIDMVSPLGPKC
jgi:hypothetical protein